MPIEVLHDVVAAGEVLDFDDVDGLLLPLLQPATASAPSAVAAKSARLFMGSWYHRRSKRGKSGLRRLRLHL
jgi:hypothetical protein